MEKIDLDEAIITLDLKREKREESGVTLEHF